MGNSDSKTVGRNQDSPEIKLKPTHKRFQNAQVKSTKENESVEAIFPVNDKKHYDEWSKKLKYNPGTNMEGVYNPTNHSYDKAGMCGSSGNIKAQYEYYPFNLEDEIKNRQESKYKRFDENELWYLLYTLSDVGSKFHNNNTKVGDIRPNNVFINEDGQINVVTKHTFPQEPDNYQKAFYDNEKTYLSPQQIKDLQIGKGETSANPGTSEAFSAGLTVLDATILDNSENLYGKNGNIDYELLQAKKENLKNLPQYGDQLKHTILNMTETLPENRMDLNELSNWLDPHSHEIINLEPFQNKALPEKLRKTAIENPITRRQKIYEPQGFYQSIPQTVDSQILKDYPKKEQISLNSDPIKSQNRNISKLQSGLPIEARQTVPAQIPIQNQGAPMTCGYYETIPQRQTVLESNVPQTNQPVYQSGVPQRQTVVESKPIIYQQANLPPRPKEQQFLINQPINQPPINQPPRQKVIVPERQTVIPERQTVVVPESAQRQTYFVPEQRQPVVYENIPRKTVIPESIVRQDSKKIIQDPIYRQESPRNIVHEPIRQEQPKNIQEQINYQPHYTTYTGQLSKTRPLETHYEKRDPIISPRENISSNKFQQLFRNREMPETKYESTRYESKTIITPQETRKTEIRQKNGEVIEKKQTVEKGSEVKENGLDGPIDTYYKFADHVLPEKNYTTQTRTIETTNKPQGYKQQIRTVTQTERVERHETRDEKQVQGNGRPIYSLNTIERLSPEGSKNEKGKEYMKQLQEKIRQSKMMYPSE